MTAPEIVTPETPPAEPVAPPVAPAPPTANAPLHDDPVIAKALEGLTPEQRETLLTQGGKNALAARLQEAKDAKAAAATAEANLAEKIGKALGLIKDEPADPAKLVEQAATAAGQARQAQVELAVYRASQGVGANPNALLDSRSFLAKVADIDPSDHLAIAAAVGEAITENPTFLTAQPARIPGPNPAQGGSGGGAPTLDDLINAAAKTGDVKTQIHLQNQKLTQQR